MKPDWPLFFMLNDATGGLITMLNMILKKKAAPWTPCSRLVSTSHFEVSVSRITWLRNKRDIRDIVVGPKVRRNVCDAWFSSASVPGNCSHLLWLQTMGLGVCLIGDMRTRTQHTHAHAHELKGVPGEHLGRGRVERFAGSVPQLDISTCYANCCDF